VFLLILLAVLAAAALHVSRTGGRSRARIGEIGLLYMLVGYCGVPMLLASLYNLARPEHVAEILGFPAGNPFQQFLGSAYVGMSVLALLALRYRGGYLVAPAAIWAMFFAGATLIHLNDLGAAIHGGHGHGHGGGGGGVLLALWIFATHGLISVLLLGFLWMSGAWRQRG
jgi:hypothetical protein